MPEVSLSPPFLHSYWVIPGRMVAGYYPGNTDPQALAAKLNQLLDAGVDTFINLMEGDEIDHQGRAFQPYRPALQELAEARGAALEMRRFPIPDLGVPTRQQMRLILNALDEALAAGRCIYLHCRGGIGRTGTVVGCFLARHGLAAGPQVLTRLDELRQGWPDRAASPETPEQTRMVTGWQEGE